MTVFIFITWIIYSSLEGYREGNYWQWLFEARKYATNEHEVWSFQRAMVFILAFLCLIYSGNWIAVFSLPLAFPFWHDGFYYRQRNKASQNTLYKKKFWDQSKASTAFFTKFNTPILRSIYFAVSIIILIFSLCWM